MRRLAVAILGALVATSALSIDTAGSLLIGGKDWIVGTFDWLFVGVASLAVLTVAVLGVHPAANVRLGPDDARPEFSNLSWFAMLFSAGLASGLLYWATAEPVLHYQGNPHLARAGIEAGTGAAVQTALRITIFHWGLHGWALYVLGGLAISIYAYRHGRPLTIRSALYPVLGPDRIDRWPGLAVDLVALLGTVCGVATSIGLSAGGLNATLHALAGLEVDLTRQIAIVFAVCGLGLLSAVSGLGRGIRRLSEVNVWVSAVLLGAVLALGPTRDLLALLVTSAGDYLATFLPMGFWIGETAREQAWAADWTVFYWGWWLAWMPFVSLFIARISRGRTVREFVLGVMGVPTLIIVVWMSTLGGTALHQELADPGAVSAAVNRDYSLGIVAMIENLARPAVAGVLMAVAAFLLFTWLITSLDSATLVICNLLEEPEANGQKVFWGLTLACVTCALLWVGGLPALQAASIIIGLPLAGVTLLMAAGILKELVGRRL